MPGSFQTYTCTSPTDTQGLVNEYVQDGNNIKSRKKKKDNKKKIISEHFENAASRITTELNQHLCETVSTKATLWSSQTALYGVTAIKKLLVSMPAHKDT